MLDVKMGNEIVRLHSVTIKELIKDFAGWLPTPRRRYETVTHKIMTKVQVRYASHQKDVAAWSCPSGHIRRECRLPRASRWQATPAPLPLADEPSRQRLPPASPRWTVASA